ncbi:MAG: polyphosphate polymerase domain-containing protein [Acutalibacter sp.]
MAIPATTTEPRLRHEEKHQVNLREALVLSQRLEKLFPRDPHAGPEGNYQVVSLYYDDPYDTALRQKLDGVNRREKFRLRYYGEKPAFFKLEKKYKVKGLCGKGSCRLSREEGERLLRGDFAFLLEKEEPLAREFYAKLRRGLAPKTVVRYTREAFLYAPGNVRVTLDGDIRAGAPERFLIPQKLLPALGGLAVVEVKYDAFLPEIVKLAVQVPNRQGTACSKYALCRRYD